MGKITFILGGARSGKSAYAIKIAKDRGKTVAFIATCEPQDPEMKKRIALHKDNRPGHWKTFEEPTEPTLLLKKIGARFDCIIIDCLTLMLSNLMLKGLKEAAIESQMNKMLSVLNKIKAKSIIISNEVGLGIVPQNKLARHFRDVAGIINQRVASSADEVIFMLSGIPLVLKKK